MSYKLFTALSSLLLVALSFQAQSATRAEVGVYGSDGSIKLHVDRFQTHFADGSAVAEVDLRISNGLVHVFRKGYDQSDACRSQMILLTDEEGLAVMPGSQPSGTRVLLEVTAETISNYCNDDGCHALKNVVLPGEPPLVRAACDQTDLSGNRCRCHIDDGAGERLTQGDFCNSRFEISRFPLVYWIKLPWIQN